MLRLTARQVRAACDHADAVTRANEAEGRREQMPGTASQRLEIRRRAQVGEDAVAHFLGLEPNRRLVRRSRDESRGDLFHPGAGWIEVKTTTRQRYQWTLDFKEEAFRADWGVLVWPTTDFLLWVLVGAFNAQEWKDDGNLPLDGGQGRPMRMFPWATLAKPQFSMVRLKCAVDLYVLS